MMVLASQEDQQDDPKSHDVMMSPETPIPADTSDDSSISIMQQEETPVKSPDTQTREAAIKKRNRKLLLIGVALISITSLLFGITATIKANQRSGAGDSIATDARSFPSENRDDSTIGQENAHESNHEGIEPSRDSETNDRAGTNDGDGGDSGNNNNNNQNGDSTTDESRGSNTQGGDTSSIENDNAQGEEQQGDQSGNGDSEGDTGRNAHDNNNNDGNEDNPNDEKDDGPGGEESHNDGSNTTGDGDPSSNSEGEGTDNDESNPNEEGNAAPSEEENSNGKPGDDEPNNTESGNTNEGGDGDNDDGSVASGDPTGNTSGESEGNVNDNVVTGPSSESAIRGVKIVLEASKDAIDTKLFLYQTPLGLWEQSSIYRYEGLASGLRVMYEDGVNGQYFYMGENTTDGHQYGLVNVAAFLAQSMKETIRYDACDENSWDLVNQKYPLSNACGQLGQSYQDYHCSPEEAHMECPVDLDMEITAITHAKWWGAPGPLKCGPKSKYPFTGFWDHMKECNKPWANPPQYCTDYEGQKGGGANNAAPYANTAGRTDVEGCCWWGRGVIQTTGVCNFGKLNYFLGKRAADEGRQSRYPTIDFCRDPEAICSSQEFVELKWVAGMFYWMESVQSYSQGGWNYMTELREFVDGGMTDMRFIDAVSGIVNRGCHNPPCGTGALAGGPERQQNFKKVLTEFGLTRRRYVRRS